MKSKQILENSRGKSSVYWLRAFLFLAKPGNTYIIEHLCSDVVFLKTVSLEMHSFGLTVHSEQHFHMRICF